ncbi:TOPRIM nucleotidyl transferase/hydrolase domain-containing protein [Sphaerisporangium sp. TRM90804]|uniref:TOPRIM nucleotidyl transferase/hydrolase domain-containing protein n=1 Tax=Sphaerisporangium sp. TRM90804 TaxID=3031113 RepID=UPI00244BD22B|nr:TOPRIM nucleotidyl transferase/hydrolase domain-containing protein [Sphaerisporangium sp. TRM90804]MDH2429373.1 ATP-dependent endonuclease [Sphaerisporangium sp. TRM90804]
MRELERFRAAIRTWAGGGAGAPAAAAEARGLARDGLGTVVLVEGVSDQSAVEALAVRRDRDLAGEGVCVVPMDGAMGVGRYLRILGRPELAVSVRGLCDEAEEAYFRRGLKQAGLGAGTTLTRDAMESLGFYVCVADLEDELIRALDIAGVERVLAAEGDLAKFRLFQNQPAQRGRAVERQLRRFMGTTSGRKAQYARALVLAVDANRVPRPLDHLLAHTSRCSTR